MEERGNDTMLFEIANRQDVLEKVIEDDARRACEEEKVDAQPGDTEEG
jgi:hypothetical protein